MKRIVYFIMIFAACVMLVCPLSISAEGIDNAPVFEVEMPEGATVTESAEAEEEAKPNIFTRIYEAFCENKTEVFTLGGSSILLVLSLILRKDLGASSKSIVNGIATVLSKSDLTSERQEAIVGGLNEMIDGYEEVKHDTAYVKKQIEEIKLISDRVEASNTAVVEKISEMFSVLVGLINKEMLQNSEVMEVLSTVYTNNDSIPKGIKDFVSLMRSENVKLVQEASQLTSKETATTEGGEAV